MKLTCVSPNIVTSRLIRAYAQWALDECYLPDDPKDPLMLAIVATDASTAEACCHMGRAMIALMQGMADVPYRLGGAMCDPRITKIAARLEMENSP